MIVALCTLTTVKTSELGAKSTPRQISPLAGVLSVEFRGKAPLLSGHKILSLILSDASPSHASHSSHISRILNAVPAF